MSGFRRGGAFWPAAAALLALAGASAGQVAASQTPPAAVRADEASSFAGRAAKVRYGFQRFEAPPGAGADCCGSDDFSDPDAGAGFSYVESAPATMQPPARAPEFALTPVPEPSSLVLLLAGIGLFILRGTVVWQGDHRRRGRRVG